MPPRRQTSKLAPIAEVSASIVAPVPIPAPALPAPSARPQETIESGVSLSNMTDNEIHAELRKYDPDYTGSGPLTEATRSVRIKKINHFEAKEKKAVAEKEKKEAIANKQAGKRKSVAQSRVETSPEREAQYVGLQLTEPSPPPPPAKRTKTAVESVSRPCVSSSGDYIKVVVTDTSAGAPARNMTVMLNQQMNDQSWMEVAKRITDGNGECPGLITRDLFRQATYRLSFDSGDYFGRHSQTSFHPYVQIVFEVEDPKKPVVIALYVGPNSYSTYITG